MSGNLRILFLTVFIFILGLCICNKGKFSSNGRGEEGISGDCGYAFNYPRADNNFPLFAKS
jgi:hypothetical protein